jgi:hypothetical protein
VTLHIDVRIARCRGVKDLKVCDRAAGVIMPGILGRSSQESIAVRKRQILLDQIA